MSALFISLSFSLQLSLDAKLEPSATLLRIDQSRFLINAQAAEGQGTMANA